MVELMNLLIGTECYVRLNGDSGANYDWQRISAVGGAITASNLAADAGWDAFVSAAATPANTFGMIHLEIPAYDGTVGFKAGRWTDGFADSEEALDELPPDQAPGVIQLQSAV
jgi:hypothetical protein